MEVRWGYTYIYIYILLRIYLANWQLTSKGEHHATQSGPRAVVLGIRHDVEKVVRAARRGSGAWCSRSSGPVLWRERDVHCRTFVPTCFLRVQPCRQHERFRADEVEPEDDDFDVVENTPSAQRMKSHPCEDSLEASAGLPKRADQTSLVG